MKRSIAIGVAVIIMLIAGASVLLQPQPQPIWSESPSSLIIEVTSDLLEIDYNDIPDVRVWGDGRIVWVIYDQNYRRQVLEGRLTHAEMTSIVQQFIATGFFYRFPFDSWSDDAGIATQVQVSLAERQRWTTKGTRTMSPPQAELVARLRAGAGTRGTLFVPTAGTIVTYTCEERRITACQTAQQWPTTRFGDTLADAHGRERPIAGAQLQLAWQIVNESRSPLVESQGQVYWVGLSIPTISK